MYLIQGAILIEEQFESVADCIEKYPDIKIQYIDGDIYLGDCVKCGDPIVDNSDVITRWVAGKGYFHNNCVSKEKVDVNGSK
jgi:hypothetical protein